MSAPENNDPFDLFAKWMHDATRHEGPNATDMALATSTPDGHPSVRMVLLKDVVPAHDTSGGFVFYTNFESRKGRELLENPNAALCFHWKKLKRQVRVEGPVVVVDDKTADAYYASRPRESRIGAWASIQSRPLEGMWALEKRVAAAAARFGVGPIPRPPYWSGFRVIPDRIEFWQDKPFRLHERLVFEKTATGWTIGRLYP